MMFFYDELVFMIDLTSFNPIQSTTIIEIMITATIQ